MFPPAAAYITSMPNAPRVNCRTINVEPGQLPSPATKLIITQILQASQDPPSWAWIIVGAFYDSNDRILWSTELFAAHLDIQLQSAEEQASEAVAETGLESEAEAEAEPESEPEAEPDSSPGTSITYGLGSLSRPHLGLYKLTLAYKFNPLKHIALHLPSSGLNILRHITTAPSTHIKAIITTPLLLPITFVPFLIFTPISSLSLIFTTTIATITTAITLRPISQLRHLSTHLLPGILSFPVLSLDTGRPPSTPPSDVGFTLGSLSL